MENNLRDGVHKIARGLLLPGCHCLVTGDKEQTADAPRKTSTVVTSKQSTREQPLSQITEYSQNISIAQL